MVLAHPDDECFVGGGALTHYAGQGVETTLLTVTDGQAGRAGVTGNDPLTDRESLGRVRREELRAAARALGIGTLVTPGWMDGQLSAMPDDAGVALVTECFQQHRPAIVISFGPEGAGNQHPDHIATSRWTLQAFDQAAAAGANYAPLKLYWITWPDSFHPIEGVKVQGSPVTTIVEIGEEAVRRKHRAFEAHATQHDFLERFRRIQEAVGPREHYHLARSRVGHPNGLERDLFERIPAREHRGALKG